MILNYILKEYHQYKRLKIELDLIDSKLSSDYPILNVITQYLRQQSYDTNKLEKELKEYYGTIESKNNSNST